MVWSQVSRPNALALRKHQCAVRHLLLRSLCRRELDGMPCPSFQSMTCGFPFLTLSHLA